MAGFGKSWRGLMEDLSRAVASEEKAAAQASWDRDNAAFSQSRRPEARGMTPTRMGVPSAEKFSLDDPKFGGGSSLPAKPQGVGAIMGKLLASPEARLENAASAKVSRMPFRDHQMDVYDFPSGANVRFHPAPDGTVEVVMGASKVGPASPASLKAQVFADAMSAIERHAKETGAAQKGASYLFSGETDAITRMFRAMGERAQLPGGAVMHDSPGGFEISFDPSRKPFEGKSAMGLFDSEAGYGLGFNRDMKPSEIINARAKQLGGPMVGGTPEALARAREQGFDVDTPLYHGTDEAFSAFDPALFGDRMGIEGGVFMTSDPRVASKYAGVDSYRDITGQTVMPLYARGRLKDINEEAAYDDLQGALDAARAEGFDGARLRNIDDDPSGSIEGIRADTYAIFDPKNVRSRFAAFDPAKKDSPDLLASALLGTTAAGGATALGSGEAEAAKLPMKRSFLRLKGEDGVAKSAVYDFNAGNKDMRVDVSREGLLSPRGVAFGPKPKHEWLGPNIYAVDPRGAGDAREIMRGVSGALREDMTRWDAPLAGYKIEPTSSSRAKLYRHMLDRERLPRGWRYEETAEGGYDGQPVFNIKRDWLSTLTPALAATGAAATILAPSDTEAKAYTPNLAALSKAGNAGWAGEAPPSPIMSGKGALRNSKDLAMAEAGVLASSPAAFSLGYYLLNDPTMQGNVAMDRAEQEWADETSKRTQQLREDYFKPHDPWGEAAKQQTFNEKLTPSEQFNSWISPFFEAAASNVPDNALNPWQGESRKQLTGQDVQRTRDAMDESAFAFPLWAQSRAQQPIDLLGDALEMADPTWFGVSAARDWVDKRKTKRQALAAGLQKRKN